MRVRTITKEAQRHHEIHWYALRKFEFEGTDKDLIATGHQL
jgi:hypothetical protein